MGRTNNYQYSLSKPYDANAINKVAVPKAIKCNDCMKVKIQDCFSSNRITELKQKIYKDGDKFNAAKTAVIKCITCTGGNRVELECTGCDKWKGLDAFAKTQRRDPDNALCILCSEERQNIEPDALSDYGGDSDDSGAESDDSDDSVLASTMVGPTSGMSLNGASCRTGGVSLAGTSTTSTSYASSSASPAPIGGVSKAPSVASSTTASEWSVSTTTNAAYQGLPAGFNPFAYRKKGPSSVASSSVAGSDISKAGSQFAKIKAGPRKIQSDAAQRLREQEAKKDGFLDEVCVEESDSEEDEEK